MSARAGGVLLAAAVALGTGCHVWRAVPMAPGEARPLPARTRVVHRSGERIELAVGRVTPDSVVGARPGGVRDAARGPVALPRDSVARVEERRVSWGRTLGLEVGILFGLLVLSGIP